jgi:hypothetical protein
MTQPPHFRFPVAPNTCLDIKLHGDQLRLTGIQQGPAYWTYPKFNSLSTAAEQLSPLQKAGITMETASHFYQQAYQVEQSATRQFENLHIQAKPYSPMSLFFRTSQAINSLLPKIASRNPYALTWSCMLLAGGLGYAMGSVDQKK